MTSDAERVAPTLTPREDGTLECSAGCPFVIWPEDRDHHLGWHVEEAKPVSERYPQHNDGLTES